MAAELVIKNGTITKTYRCTEQTNPPYLRVQNACIPLTRAAASDLHICVKYAGETYRPMEWAHTTSVQQTSYTYLSESFYRTTAENAARLSEPAALTAAETYQTIYGTRAQTTSTVYGTSTNRQSVSTYAAGSSRESYWVTSSIFRGVTYGGWTGPWLVDYTYSLISTAYKTNTVTTGTTYLTRASTSATSYQTRSRTLAYEGISSSMANFSGTTTMVSAYSTWR